MNNPAIDVLIADSATVCVLSALTNEPDEILAKLQAAFLAGVENGESILVLADRVQSIIAVSRDKALSITGNTIGFVMSKLRFDSAISGGMTHKTWLCAPNCPILGHGIAGDTYKTPIPILEPFIVNGVPLMYPRDFMSDHIEECIDCQCTSIASLVGRGRRSQA